MSKLKIFSILDFFSSSKDEIDFPDSDLVRIEGEQENIENRKRLRAERIKQNSARWLPVIQEFFTNKFDQKLFVALIQNESDGNPLAVSSKFAFGLTQITQVALSDVNLSFGTRFVLAEMKDAKKNLFVASKLTELLRKRGANDVVLFLQAWNCGLEGARKNKQCGREFANRILDDMRLINQFGII